MSNADALFSTSNPAKPTNPAKPAVARVIFASDAYTALLSSLQNTLPHETAGALVGDIERTGEQEWISITHVVPVGFLHAGLAASLPKEEWERLTTRLTANRGNQRIVGCYYALNGTHSIRTLGKNLEDAQRAYAPDATLCLLVDTAANAGRFYILTGTGFVAVEGFYEGLPSPDRASLIPWEGVLGTLPPLSGRLSRAAVSNPAVPNTMPLEAGDAPDPSPVTATDEEGPATSTTAKSSDSGDEAVTAAPSPDSTREPPESQNADNNHRPEPPPVFDFWPAPEAPVEYHNRSSTPSVPSVALRPAYAPAHAGSGPAAYESNSPALTDLARGGTHRAMRVRWETVLFIAWMLLGLAFCALAFHFLGH